MQPLFGSTDEARRQIEELVERYTPHRAHYRSATYNEETARNELIHPLFAARG